jgi:tetratricopeptide (TPR) repeat protein
VAGPGATTGVARAEGFTTGAYTHARVSASVLLRGALVVVALVVLGWLAVSLRATNLVEDGNDVVVEAQRGAIPPGELRRGRDLFHRARRFNADLDPWLREGFLLLLSRRNSDALADARNSVRREPENFNAWYLLYLAAQGAGDRDEAARARRAIVALNPLVANRLDTRLSGGS